jgi:hypothetical protein
VRAVLLWGNSTSAYISYQSFLPESLSYAYHSINILMDIIGKKLLSLNPRTFLFTESSVVISFKGINQDYAHFFCVNIKTSRALSSFSGQCTTNLLNSEMYYTAADYHSEA